jgi:hypothetical protein
MTATGIALIAGGLATLICFRRVLWMGRGRGAGPKRRAARAAIEAPRRPVAAARPAILPAQANAPEISGAHFTAENTPEPAAASGPRRSRRRADRPRAVRVGERRDGGERSGLASIGLADEDCAEFEFAGPEFAEPDLAGPEFAEPEFGEPDLPEADHDNVDQDLAASDVEARRDERSHWPTGDYWMPIPESAYADLEAPGCNWPVRGDRGWPIRPNRDPALESEPTAVVPTWPPARPFDRIELPRTWSEGPGRRALPDSTVRRWDEADRNGGRRGHQPNDEVADRYWDELDRDGRDGWRRNSGPEDGHLALRAAEPRRRPRPRPNPTIYVSRHAAE